MVLIMPEFQSTGSKQPLEVGGNNSGERCGPQGEKREATERNINMGRGPRGKQSFVRLAPLTSRFIVVILIKDPDFKRGVTRE